MRPWNLATEVHDHALFCCLLSIGLSEPLRDHFWECSAYSHAILTPTEAAVPDEMRDYHRVPMKVSPPGLGVSAGAGAVVDGDIVVWVFVTLIYSCEDALQGVSEGPYHLI